MWGILTRHLATALAVIGVFWTLGRPLAQDFIEDTVEERIGQIESQLSRLQIEQTATNSSVIRTERDMELVKELQKESRRDVKELLKSLRAVERNLE